MPPRKLAIATQLAVLSVIVTVIIFYHDFATAKLLKVVEPLQNINSPKNKGTPPTSTSPIQDNLHNGTIQSHNATVGETTKNTSAPAVATHKVLKNVNTYVKAILDPLDTHFPRLECPSTDLSRYSQLQAKDASATPNTKWYFFALDLRQCVGLLPRLLGSVVDAMRFLGPQACALSIVEGNSKDGTSEVLEAIRTEIEALGATYSFQSTDINPSKDDRIVKLAKLRNLALQPMLKEASRYSTNTTVIFLNDVAICVEDILELVYQRQHQNADMVCAMDWTYVGPDPTFYDVWVARTLSGDLFFDIPIDGNWNSAWNLFWNSPETRTRYDQHLPFQVFSCWNGAVVFSAAPFLDKTVSFRGPKKDECFQGEPQLFCKDLWYKGHNRIAVVPSVNLEYSDSRGKGIKALKGYASQLISADPTGEKDRISWQTEPPAKVKCMPSFTSQEWKVWNESLSS